MIEPMKKVYLVVQTARKRQMLKALRKAGIVHVQDAPKPVHSGKADEIGKQAENYARIESALLEFGDAKKTPQKQLDEKAFSQWAGRLTALLDQRKALNELVAGDTRELERIQGWGDFHVEELKALERQGIKLAFYTIGPKELASLDASIPLIVLSDVDGQKAIAVVGSDAYVPGGRRFDLPAKDAQTLRDELETCRKQLEGIQAELEGGVAYLDALKRAEKVNAQAAIFQKTSDEMGGDDVLSYLVGYLPARIESSFTELAGREGWGYALEDPEDDDNPPTLLRYPKGFSLMQPIYNILGTYPGYRERDISVPFLLFFMVFFAMIIGDGGYGLVFLLAGLGLRKAQKQWTDTNMLVIVLAIATIVWGAVTGTWFGSTWILEHVPFLRMLVIPTLANIPQLFLNASGEVMDAKTVQDNVMNFCFILGTVQLALACVMNVLYKLPRKNLSWVSDVAWFVDLVVLYQLILTMLLPSVRLPLMLDTMTILKIVAVGYVVVILFRNQDAGKKFSDGVKEGLMGFLPTFLDTISCFSNIMSYIRLFAVGMAGFAISQSFNSMALGVAGAGRLVGVIGFMLIVLLGHTLNIVMCLLSVIVHGVRLNILEFSNQLGMEWSGYKYDPFRETVKSEN